MKQNLYSVIKISTAKIRRKMVKEKVEGSKTKIPKEPLEFNLGDYTLSMAKLNKEVVSIGDNLVFHKIREYYGDTRTHIDIYDEIQSLKKEIQDIKKLQHDDNNKKQIKELQKKINDNTYVKDIVNVKVSNKEHYKEIALTKFTMNDITYKRLCCGSGQMRRNTVTFVNEKLYDYLIESLMCGLNGRIEKITLAKLSAYFALSFSSVLWVRKPRICVIPDFETLISKQNIDFIKVNENGKKVVEPRIMDLKLNSCDGEGLISPECAEWFSEDMGLGYTACQFVVRSAFVKGNLLTFDFKSYAKDVCGISKIKSIYGEWFNIDEVDVLLTESMFKMHKYYTSCKEYQEFHDKYNLKWGVARYNKKYDDDCSLLNYQYIQNNNLSDKDIDNLIQPTVDWFTKICSGDKLYSTLYAIGCKNKTSSFNEMMESCGSIYTKAIVQNSKMLEDGYVKKKLYESIKESFRQAKIGRLWSRGGYQFMLSDPIPLVRNALGLDATGLIPANHVYSAYWNKYNPLELDLCRSPMVDRHEHNIVKLAKSSEMDKWYKYLYSGIIYSIYDTGTIRHSDSDFDGDIVYSTDNIQLINGAYRNNNPITYDKEKAPEMAVTYENIVKCDLDGFDTLVGQITNNSTSITAMLPNFPVDKYPEQHNELINRLKLLREIIGAEIDKIKLGVAPEFPKEWIERVKINDDDSDIDKAQKYKHNSMVICKKAYFMIYLYDTLEKSYRNHIKQFDLDCKNKYGMTYKDLKYLKGKTKGQKKFLRRIEYFSPVLDTACTMNKICHKIEKLEDDILYDKSFEKSILSQFNTHKYVLDEEKIKCLTEIYKSYQAQKKFEYMKQLMGEILTKDCLFEYLSSMRKALTEEFQQLCTDNITTNIEELFEYMLSVAKEFENNNKPFDYSFIWDILDLDILNVIPKENSLMCIEDKDGKEYLGRRYKLVEVQK